MLTSKSTYGELYEIWSKDILRQSNASDKYIFSSGFPNYLLPHISHWVLEDIDESFARESYELIDGMDRCNEYKKKLHRYLRRSIDYAICLNLIGQNPCKGMLIPTEIAKKPSIYSHRQIKKLIPYMDKSILRFLFDFVLNSGVNRSEVENLAWDEVDFDRCEIRLPNRNITMTSKLKKCLLNQAELINVLLSKNPALKEFDIPKLVFLGENLEPARYVITRECNAIISKGVVTHFSLTHLRDYYIVNSLKNGSDIVTLAYHLGIKDPISLKRYLPYSRSPLTNTLTDNMSTLKYIETILNKYRSAGEVDAVHTSASPDVQQEDDESSI